jgi:hypothetical protein
MPLPYVPPPPMSPPPGSDGRIAVLQLLARHPEGLHEAEMLIGLQIHGLGIVKPTELRELLRALQQPRGTSGHPRPALVARELRQGRWYSPQAREAADARAGRRLDPSPTAQRGTRTT